MAPTERLHHDDSLLLEFDATVVAVDRSEDRAWVVLDRSAFYPESGGQMADHGALGAARVVDVQVDERGVVRHLVERLAVAPGETVHGAVDGERRRIHRALHTGQHVLSRALWEVARAETVSSRLGETLCTIDVDRADVSDALLSDAETLAGSVVDGDLPVRAWFPDPAELADLALRRAPTVTEGVRVVDIGGFDVSPCGGTHCTRTSQIGLVWVVGSERYKGGTRVKFHAGRRAREHLVSESRVLRGLGRAMTCAPHDVPDAVARTSRDLDATRAALGVARARLTERIAAELAQAAEGRPVVARFDDLALDDLRSLASRLAVRPGAVALIAGATAEGLHVIAQRGPGSDFDCGAFLVRVARETGGRGGGRPDRAEGRLPASADWVALTATIST